MSQGIRSILRRLQNIHGKSRMALPKSRLLQMEMLEERRLLSTYQVQSDADSGDNTLRWAIERANTITHGYDTIVIMDLSYSLSAIELQSQLPTITEGVTILTQSGDQFSIDGTNYVGRGFVVDIPGTNPYGDVSLSGVYVYNTAADSFSVYGDGVDNVTLYNCVAQGTTARPGGAGIFIHNDVDADSVTISNSYFVKKHIGISHRGSATELSITGNYIGTDASYNTGFGNTTDGIFLDGSGLVTISGNVIASNGDNGIELDGGGSTALQVGIYLNAIGSSPDGTVSLPNASNGIDSTAWHGDASSNSFIQQNTIKNNGSSGIEMFNCQDVMLALNMISNNSDHGVKISAAGTNETVEGIHVLGNEITDNTEDGIHIRATNTGSVNNINIQPAVIGNNKYRNYLEDNEGNGIVISSNGNGSTVSDIDILGTTIDNNTNHGVLITSTNGSTTGEVNLVPAVVDNGDGTVTIMPNYMRYNGGDGVAVMSDGTSSCTSNINIIPSPGYGDYGNYIIDNSDNGISINSTNGGSAFDVDIIGNTFNENGNNAIVTENSTVYGVCCSQNEFEDLSDPILLISGSNHGLVAPQVMVSGIIETYTNWSIPVSLDAGATFANKDFTFEYYACNPATGEYAYITSATATLDAYGNGQASATVTTSDVPSGWQVTVLAVCDDIPANGVVAGDSSEFAEGTVDPRAARVLDQYVFYNNSYLDASPYDDEDAIDPTKEAWFEGEAVDEDLNVTAYSKGINGIMIDIFDLEDPSGLSAGDFVFEYGTGGSWNNATATPTISVEEGAGTGGSDRVAITWPDGSFTNTWFRATVLANDNTGLQNDYLFCFGNLVGDATGDTDGSADNFVGGDDLDLVRSYWGQTGGSIDVGDFNLDNFVGGDDLDAVRGNWGGSLDSPFALALAMVMDDSSNSPSTTDVDALFSRWGFDDLELLDTLMTDDTLWDEFMAELSVTMNSPLGGALEANALAS